MRGFFFLGTGAGHEQVFSTHKKPAEAGLVGDGRNQRRRSLTVAWVAGATLSKPLSLVIGPDQFVDRSEGDALCAVQPTRPLYAIAVGRKGGKMMESRINSPTRSALVETQACAGLDRTDNTCSRA